MTAEVPTDARPGLESCVLLEIQTLNVLGSSCMVMFDSGSSATLVTHSFAKRIGLQCEEVSYYLRVVDHGYTAKRTLMYYD